MISAARRKVWAIHFLLFASGALALVYELLWMRQFTVVFGANTPAVAATLAALFFGFTAGNVVVGRAAARIRRPLRGYAVLEVGIAAGAALVPLILRLYDAAYPKLFAALSSSTLGFAVLKGLLAAVALFIPAFCMGGTVPLLGQLIATHSKHLGIGVAGLYAANVIGAAIGALSVPFLLLPILGASSAYFACVGGNLIVAGLAWWMAPTQSETPQPNTLKGGHRATITMPFRRLMALAAASGFLFFVLQVSWERTFAQVHENSIYSFSVVLALLLLGLSAGSGITRILLRRGVHSIRALSWSWTVAGIIVVLTPFVFYWLTGGLSYLQGSGWPSYAARLVGIALPTVLLPSVFSGMVLPLIIEIAGVAGDKPAGQIVGSILGANTAGAIAGAITGVALLPSGFGLWGTFLFAGSAMIAVGQFAGNEQVSGKTILRWATIAVLIGIGWWMSATLPRTRLGNDRLLAIEESSHGVVAVVERDNSRRIKLNNYYVLGGTASTGDERMQAHIPLLLHPAPKRVAFLGIGTGITVGTSLLHPVDKVTAVEIVPEVATAASRYFKEANLAAMDSSRVRIVAEDARNFLRGSGEKFDVIIGDLFVPWRRAEASLYTREHFMAARRALANGGLFCQWLPMFQLSEAEFNMIAATFLDVFPNSALWRGDFSPTQPALALVGHSNQAAIDVATVARQIGEMQPDPANPFLAHPAGLWLFLVGPLDDQAGRFANSRRHLESRPWLELLGPLAHAGSKTANELFVGRPLAAFLSQVLATPLTGTPLAKLGPSELEWRHNGIRFAEATLLMAEGKQGAAEGIFSDLARTLPAEVRSLVAGP